MYHKMEFRVVCENLFAEFSVIEAFVIMHEQS